jgi:hypothetical protein
MLFVVVERFRRQGRMMPDGVEYVDSWMTADASRCYQLMEARDETALAA